MLISFWGLSIRTCSTARGTLAPKERNMPKVNGIWVYLSEWRCIGKRGHFWFMKVLFGEGTARQRSSDAAVQCWGLHARTALLHAWWQQYQRHKRYLQNTFQRIDLSWNSSCGCDRQSNIWEDHWSSSFFYLTSSIFLQGIYHIYQIHVDLTPLTA